MKFGASTWLWTSPFTSDKVELLQKIAELGFDFVEIPVENPGDIDAKALVPVLRDLNLEAVVCTAVVGERDLSTDDPQIRQTAFDYFEACIVLAKPSAPTAWLGRYMRPSE